MLSSITNFIFYHTPLFYLIQSVWRDEAFSYFMAKPNILQVIANTASDFNPPLYYLLLHFWMKIVGQSDVGLRLLSFLPHIATVYVSYLLAKKLFSRNFAYFISAFTFANPMLLYYAFEMRMYSFYAMFTLLTLYFFYLKNWKWYTVATVLGLYTHSFFILVPVSFLIYYWVTKQLKKKTYLYLTRPFIFFLPWLPILISQFLRSKDSWLYPVDLQLILSVVGNLFTAYEGTPGNLWTATYILSSIMSAFFILGFRKNRQLSLLFLIPIFVPLFAIIFFSILFRPIYVARYLIFITVFEIIALSLGIWIIKDKKIKRLLAYSWLIFVVVLNIFISPYRKKTDFKLLFAEINNLATADDTVYAKTPIGFFESIYYYKYPNQVFVYNPNNISIPNYIGINVVFPNVSQTSFPSSPSRTFLVTDDASFEIIMNQ